MDSKKEKFLSLLLIGNNSFANSYDLCRVLSRLFGLINCHEIIQSLEEENFIIINKIEYGVEHFTISDEGFTFVNKNKERLISELKVDFPQEADFVVNISKFLIG